jgi:hypothetical protein
VGLELWVTVKKETIMRQQQEGGGEGGKPVLSIFILSPAAWTQCSVENLQG